MTVEQCETMIDQVIDDLPDDIAGAVEDLEIFVASSRADTKTLREAVTASGVGKVAIPQDFRAVFLGSPLDPAGDDEDPDPDPPEGVILVNAAMLRNFEDVQFTLLHEFGHALGLDEDEIAALGLE